MEIKVKSLDSKNPDHTEVKAKVEGQGGQRLKGSLHCDAGLCRLEGITHDCMVSVQRAGSGLALLGTGPVLKLCAV